MIQQPLVAEKVNFRQRNIEIEIFNAPFAFQRKNGLADLFIQAVMFFIGNNLLVFQL